MDEDWLDCSTIDSAYECQVDLRSRPALYRHRRRQLPLALRRGSIPANDMSPELDLDWRPGLPPDWRS